MELNAAATCLLVFLVNTLLPLSFTILLDSVLIFFLYFITRRNYYFYLFVYFKLLFFLQVNKNNHTSFLFLVFLTNFTRLICSSNLSCSLSLVSMLMLCPFLPYSPARRTIASEQHKQKENGMLEMRLSGELK